MATAPRPGVGARLEADLHAQQMMDSGFRIHCKAENRTVEVLFGDISSEDELACINETGLSPMQIADKTMDNTSALVFYWLGRRAQGDREPFSKLTERYGTPRLFYAAGFEAWGLGLLADDDDEIPEEGQVADPTQPGGQ